MTKKKTMFEDMKASLNEAIGFANGTADLEGYRIHIPPEMDVRALRKRLGMTQEEFASRFGFNVARLRDWEQGRTHPDAALRAYLMVIERKPEAVQEALAAA
ncbi:MAG: helix-turn-helix domain-containing protein [Rhizomicrobium sp.]